MTGAKGAPRGAPAANREARLEALREEAAGRSPVTETDAPSYYGRPVLKPPVWTWEVPAYLFVGGAAGAAAVIAWVAATVAGDVALARDARGVAAAGAVASPLLLISDLGRPGRFFNMFRVFKPQSPMSVGAWTLAVFAAAVFASIAIGAPDAPDRAAIRYATDAVAALSGLVLATYTGVLIGVSAVPVWRRYVRVLPWHFAASSLGAAVSVLELMGHAESALNHIGIAAAAFVTILAARMELGREAVSRPLVTGPSGLMARLGDALCGPVPLVLRVAAGVWPPGRSVAAVLAIGGSLLTRVGWMAAGRRSAADSRPST